MALVSRFFDNVTGYDQEQFAEVFATVHGNGVDASKLNRLAVSAQAAPNMTVRVDTGEGWVNGHWMRNTASYDVTVTAAHASLVRYDVIVLLLTTTGSPGTIVPSIHTGTPGAGVPTLTKTATVYEVPLAVVTVGAAVATITNANIADARTGMVNTTANVPFNDGGSVIAAGLKYRMEAAFACKIIGVSMFGGPSGSIQCDIKKSTYAAFPTTSSICASALPAISGAQKSQDLTLTGWTTDIAEGDILEFSVVSCTTMTNVTLSLRLARVLA